MSQQIEELVTLVPYLPGMSARGQRPGVRQGTSERRDVPSSLIGTATPTWHMLDLCVQLSHIALFTKAVETFIPNNSLKFKEVPGTKQLGPQENTLLAWS